ncbi:MAG: small subunit DoxD [Thermoleophilia bacterium]|nr:small subunit DoxD [Thermoleophilia bacterium]
MDTALSSRERGIRVALAALLAVVVLRLGFGGTTPELVEAIGATVVGLFALGTGLYGRSPNFLGAGGDYAVGYLAARLFVGWEFLYAGWEKLTGDGWVGSSAGTGISGFLKNATSARMTSGDHPAVSGWFADLTSNVFLPHAEIMSYAIVFGELAVGLGLIVGLCTRTAAFFAVTLNMAFLLGGSTSAGVNPEMLVAGLLVVTGAALAVHTLGVDRVLPRILGRGHTEADRTPVAIPRGARAVGGA